MIDERRIEAELSAYSYPDPVDYSTQCRFTDREMGELLRLARLGLKTQEPHVFPEGSKIPVPMSAYLDRRFKLGEWAEKHAHPALVLCRSRAADTAALGAAIKALAALPKDPA